MESREQQGFERFEQYLAGELPERERELLESSLEEDPAFRQDFEDFVRIKKLGYAAGRLAEKEELHEISSRFHLRRKRRRTLWIAVGTMAAGLLILLALSSIRFSPTASSPQDLYATHFELPDAPATLGTVEDSLLQAANRAYDEKDYASALQGYESIQVDSLSTYKRSELALYQGLCYLAIGEPAAARQSLAKATQHLEQADWYQALSWLQQGGNSQQAIDAFQQIANQPDHFYQAEAKEVLEELGEK